MHTTCLFKCAKETYHHIPFTYTFSHHCLNLQTPHILNGYKPNIESAHIHC